MENQVTVVVSSDGRIIHTEQQCVFRRSNKQNRLVALLDFPRLSVVKANFRRADGVKPNSQYMTYTGEQTYEGESYRAYEYLLTNYQLNATGQLVVSLDVMCDDVTATVGDFTIDVEASEAGKDDVAPSDPNQYDEALQGLIRTDSKLIDLTANVPNLVASIQKVKGSSNAFTYTDNSGVESAPIVEHRKHTRFGMAARVCGRRHDGHGLYLHDYGKYARANARSDAGKESVGELRRSGGNGV